MSQTNIDDLLQRVQEVAQAVNQFKSETIQERVFDLLMRASNLESNHTADARTEQNTQNSGEKADNTKAPKSSGRTTAAKSNRGSSKKPSLLTHLNLRPSGKKSLTELADEKKPLTNEERFAVIVHFFQNELSESNIGQDHIYTAFKEMDVKVPVNIYDALAKCAERKGWIETKDMADITLTTRGENFVEHDLPHTQDAK